MTGAPSPKLSSDTLMLWLALRQLPGVGTRTQHELLENFGSIENIFSASRGQLDKALAGKSEAVNSILAGPATAAFQTELDWLNRPGHHLLVWSDTDYPRLLREIADPPVLLHVMGNRQVLSSPQVAIVGSRNPSPMGRENAQAFARSLAGAGLTVTSGLALGVDAAAHRGALAAGGMTIAVAGTGLDRVYPARHRDLAHEIVTHGALVSEFALGTPPLPENFPIRNRLISGLSLGTLVVEAALQSGSLITARLATEQGREVFAIPGSIHAPQSRGCHALIRQGAKLVETAQDILEELGPLASVARHITPDSTMSTLALDPPMAVLLQQIGHDPVSVDALIERSGLTADVVSSMLLQMELNGLVLSCPGGKVQRIS
ncbi:MAG: DNA-processing protein DprA [Sulfuricaulis sp.]|uniref:DNA-processing protein DprA n=1 Tax=Sulfuricaulis sp. TaxID=2003553 RepID=UPI0025F684B4|nr:DNA-processing protein DprA [Sulfuricaulis sp.]MCR4345762.1 DNA-processing protein DprA [Sulfuricaulis sp.]